MVNHNIKSLSRYVYLQLLSLLSDIYLEMIAEIDTDESGTVDFDGELWNNSSISILVIFI